MAPADKVRLPMRWEFAPLKSPRDGMVRWTWRAYTQAGRLAMEAEAPFETLTECMEDAKLRGYGGAR